MELKELVGSHQLSGFDYGYDEISGGNYAIFILDNVKYLAREDECDGYRSMMGELKITNKHISNVFIPIDVVCRMKDDGENILQIYDSKNNKLILYIGTLDFDAWYPCFICDWTPENMSINEGVI